MMSNNWFLLKVKTRYGRWIHVFTVDLTFSRPIHI